MSTTVSDVSGNRNDKIANAAKVLGRAPQRTLVFIKLYSGKKRKTVSEIMELTKLSQVRVLQETKKLVAEDLISEVPEEKMKKGLMRILNETGKPPKDWGGEKNDLFTTKLKIDGARFHAAFALKGPGKKVKKLTSKDMGENGDQIQRLLRSSAQVVFVQYWRGNY